MIKLCVEKVFSLSDDFIPLDLKAILATLLKINFGKIEDMCNFLVSFL